MPQFYTKRGLLTPYGLACGYLEQTTHKGVQVTLWREHSTYHIRAHDFNTHSRLGWEVCETLKEARRVYKEFCRKWA
jgi:hypothetical protein